MLQQVEIQTTVTRMLHAIDALDWSTFRSLFTPELDLDYTSLFRGQPETLSIDTLLGRWVPFAHGYDTTHHQIGPVVIVDGDDERAIAEAHVRADHVLAEAKGGVIWTAAGHYRWTLERRDGEWKIAGIIFQLHFQDGNRELPALATARGAAGKGRPRA